ncbi:kinase-like domain-containing protein [Apiospora arundinis]
MAIIRGHLNSSEALPVTADHVTAEWCSKALGCTIKEITVLGTIHGTASKLIIGLAFANGFEKSGLPDRLCVKGGFDPDILAIYPGLNAIYRREVEFYYYVAPLINMRLPKAWYCGSDTVNGQGIVIMDDLQSNGCTFGNPLEPWPVARVRAGVEQLAALHAGTWAPKTTMTAEEEEEGEKNEKRDGKKSFFPWLAGGSALPAVILALFEPEPWARRYAEGQRPPSMPDDMLDRERMRAALQKLWAVSDARYQCLVHGDAHLGNTYVTAEGDPGFIDWQGLAVGSAFDDVPYFIVGALTVADRREHEVELVEHYLDSLAALGGPRLVRDEVWDEYRRHMMHGFVWALTDPHMQPNEVVFVMVERYTTAMADHGTLGLLEC